MSKISSRVDLALHKPVHTNENRKTAVCITDGNPSTCWTSTLYPAYAQIDLRGCYRLSRIVIRTPAEGATLFDVYASADGVNFSRIAQKVEEMTWSARGGCIFR